MRAAANGPSSPYSINRRASAAEMDDVFQPNSCFSGVISTPGMPMAAAVESMTRKVTATIAHP